jgi:hypothetical protein
MILIFQINNFFFLQAAAKQNSKKKKIFASPGRSIKRGF